MISEAELKKRERLDYALQKLRDEAKWECNIYRETVYWTDPETDQEHKTLQALRILEGRTK